MCKFSNIGKVCGLLLFSMISNFIVAQNQFIKKVFKTNADSLFYNILFPIDLNRSTEGKGQETLYPLILFLHGAGERGSDNESQTLHIRDLFLNIKNQRKYPAFVIAPQCPLNEQWVNLNWTKTGHSMPEACSKTLMLTIKLLDEIVKENSIDTTRIYVIGVSMGGYGAWDVISRFPEKFAAAIPICGGGDSTKAINYRDIPIWAFHGSADKVVPVENTRNLINAVKIAGGYPKYTEYVNVGHGCWFKAFKEGDLLEWLFIQKK